MDILTGVPIVITLLVAFFAAGGMVFVLAFVLSKRTAERNQSSRRVASLYQVGRAKASRIADLEKQLYEPSLGLEARGPHIVEIPYTGSVQLKSGGTLAFSEFYRHPGVPFHPQRAYWIFNWGMDSQGEPQLRGAHAHRENEQFFVVVRGGVRFSLATGARATDVVAPRLQTPTQGLYVPPLTFVTMEPLTDDTILVCFCSRHFDEADYIREWDEFVKLCPPTEPPAQDPDEVYDEPQEAPTP